MTTENIDTVGPWAEQKLEIIRAYSSAYSSILKKQQIIKHFAYIDGFAGAGHHVSRTTGQTIEGSPTIALQCGFSHCHFVDLDGKRTAMLERMSSGRSDVSIYTGDCSKILLQDIFPQCQFKDFRRALCLLDPYDLNPQWEVVQTAGNMKSIELFINFMIMDANMNVFLKAGPDAASERQILRMTAFWGDETWRDAAYVKKPGLFGDVTEKTINENIASAYRRRLKEVAGFSFVPEPVAMLSSTGAVIYYLFFASHNETGAKIARSIFDKYRKVGWSSG